MTRRRWHFADLRQPPTAPKVRRIRWYEGPLSTIHGQGRRNLSIKNRRRLEEGLQLPVGASESRRVVTQQLGAMTSTRNKSAKGSDEGSRGEIGHNLKVDSLCAETHEHRNVSFVGFVSSTLGSPKHQGACVVHTALEEGSGWLQSGRG